MDSVLLIDKPKGWTSHDVVAKVRSLIRQGNVTQLKKLGISHFDAVQGGQALRKIRVGHAGTLDPLATGLLIVLVGKATKRQDEFMKQDKVYEVTLHLGQTSTTADAEGEKTVVSTKKPSQEEVKKALQSFVGTIQQVPPVFSAIKVDGKRAYKLARAGKEVALEPRTVTIYSVNDVSYGYPHVRFTTKVSSGTYIRSLAVDIGDRLQTGAYMSDLHRTAIGNFNVSEAQNIDELDPSERNSVET